MQPGGVNFVLQLSDAFGKSLWIDTAALFATINLRTLLAADLFVWNIVV
jgi:hypothetical protein